MNQLVEKISWWRKLLLIPVTVIALVLIVASGGGGGGGDDDGPTGDFGDEPPIIPTTLRFLLASLPDDEPLTVNAGSDLTVTVNFTDIVFGTVDLTVNADNTVIFDSYSTTDTEGMEVTVSSLGGSTLDGTFEFIVVNTRPIETNIGDNPHAGHFEVVTPTEMVTVKILSATEVQIVLNDPGEPISLTYTWDEFTDLLGDDLVDTWQRRASLAANVYEFIYELALTVGDSLDELGTVVVTNPIVESCDMFTGTQPAGVLAQGETTITWLGSGEMTSGDNFEWRFTDCWLDEPLDDTDDLINGVVRLENYSEAVTVANILLEIGFGSLGGGRGGVFFDNLLISETQEDTGVFTIDPDDNLTVNGGFVLLFQKL